MKLTKQLTSIKNIFQPHKIFVHPIYLINNPLYNNFKIIESVSFDNSKLEIMENSIFIKEYTFTGLRGTLSLNSSNYINNSDYKNKIIEYLSLFSGRLFQLRYEYLYKYLPVPNNYVKKFFNNCCGFNMENLLNIHNNDFSIPYKYLLNKNKNIENLKNILKIYTKGEIVINKYSCF